MCRHFKTLLLFCSLWHVILCAELNTTVAQVKLLPADIQDLQTWSNASAAQLLPLAESDGEDTETVEAPQESVALEVHSSEESSRYRRQLFYDPSLLMLTNFGAEGSKCITSRGYAGICVRFTACQQFYRFKRQLNFLALRQWPQAPGVGQDICSFYDPFGRPNTGICCTSTFMGNGLGGAGMFPPFIYPGGVNPLPIPPTIPTRPSNSREEATEDELEEEKDEEDIIELDHPTEIDPLVDPLHVPAAGSRPEFQAENNVVYDPINEDEDSKPQTTIGTPVSTYNEFAYQWPSQFGNQFTGAHQWPPPLPTHPPSTAVWPPPLPTHPPNHHYPTHASVTTKPTAHTTTRRTTTKRPPAVTTPRPTTTTTRRPSYPSYPGYPGYPNYPIHRPTAAPTTTRRPTYPATPISSGSSDHGLPAQCGIKNPATPDQERIVGGTNASPHEFPWIAVLFKSGKQFCGGSVITKNHILTAAHCVARMTSWDVAALTAHLGDYDIRTNYEVQHVVRRIKRLVRHKGFDFSTLHNDIAILTVNEPMKFTYEVQPICLPTGSSHLSRSYSGKVATVAGWGSLRENGPQPSILQKVQIPIWANHDCARKYGRAAPGGIIESMVCAGQASKDSCSGDSGGPLIVNESGRYTLVGIVSWGIGCGKGEYPGVYTRITSLLPWIYKNIK